MNPLDTIANILDPTGRLKQRLTDEGGNGLLAPHQLPEGWASITHWYAPYTDRTEEFYGPIITETDTHITLNVSGEPHTFETRHCRIERAHA
jgi:hypothetical protein